MEEEERGRYIVHAFYLVCGIDSDELKDETLIMVHLRRYVNNDKLKDETLIMMHLRRYVDNGEFKKIP